MNQQTFTAQLRSILRDNGGRRLVRGQTSGILDTTRLARLAVPSRGRPNVFAHVEARRDVSYHVGILLDASGSMCDRPSDRINIKRYEAAYAAAHGLARALSAAGCAISAAAFNQYVRFWPAAELVSGAPRLYAEYADMAQRVGYHQNYDASALELMRRHMAKQRESVRLVVVLSDGCPTDTINDRLRGAYQAAGAWYESQQQALPQVVRRCEAGGVAVVGIGINSEDVRAYYERSAVVHDLKDLYPTMLAQVSAVIKRGR